MHEFIRRINILDKAHRIVIEKEISSKLKKNDQIYFNLKYNNIEINNNKKINTNNTNTDKIIKKP